MDLTDFSGATNAPRIPRVAPKSNSSPQENLRVPDNEEAKEFRKSHWTIDKFVDDNQVAAGEVDASHVEFLKNTEMVKEGVNHNEQ